MHDMNTAEQRRGSKTRILTAEDRIKLVIEDSLPKEVREALNDDRTIEVMLNCNGKVFQERLGEKMRRICFMERGDAEEIIRQVAGLIGKEVTADDPILECEWPLDGSRFAAQIPPIVKNPTFTIRKRAIQVFTLKDYVSQGIMTPNQCEVIRTAIAERRNIIVVGGTGSGKTTLGNAILHEITIYEPDARQIIIEDTCEIQSTAENRIEFRTTHTTVIADLLKTTLRMRPDRIIVGEVRGREANELIQAWNTGHPGGFCTLHSNDCASALNRLKSLISMHPYAPREIEPDIALAVDLLINIVKGKTKRRIKEIVQVGGYSRMRQENGGYELTVIA